VTILETGKT